VSALIAIFAIFSGSAILLVAVLAYWLRRRAAQEPKPRTVKQKRRKNSAAGAPEPEPEPAPPPRKGRSRLISATSLAEAEAANSAPEEHVSKPAVHAPDSAPFPAPFPVRASPLALAARQAIVFRQHFPPHLGAKSRSFYGGAPYVPGTMEWPRGSASGKPLHFILQIDLAAVPAEARLGLLPDTGVLAVFQDLVWGAGDAFRVMWQDGYVGTPWQELDPPRDLTAAYGDEAAYSWPWALTPEHGIPLLPRWPFEPVHIAVPEASPLDEEDEEEEGIAPSWGSVGNTAQALLEAQFGSADAPELAAPYAREDFTGPDEATFASPWSGFPQDWLSVQTCAAALLRQADRELRYPSGWLYAELDPAARAELVTRVKEEAQAWFDHALANPALGPVAAPERKAFWDWLAGYKPIASLIMPGAIEAAIETVLHTSPHEAAQIPPDVTARLAYRHVLARRTGDGIHAVIPTRMLAPYSDVQGEEHGIATTHLLLLELRSNEPIGHRFGEGVYQFWITPKDLADRRFEQVVLTRAAY